MKTLFFTFLACLLVGCASDTKEEKIEHTASENKTEVVKDEAILSKKDNTVSKKPVLSKEDSIRLNTKLSPKFISENRDIIELLQESDSVVIVSFERLWETIGDSLKYIRERVILTPKQRIAFVKRLNKYATITIKEVGVHCWFPHHKVYFYTKQGIALWEICFHCNRDQSIGISFLNASNVRLEKGDIIAKLFKKFGLTYQL